MEQKDKTKEELVSKNAFIYEVLDSLPYSFYVVDADNYKVLLANKASGIDVSKNIVCYAVTHKKDKPCEGEHVCPLKIVKETKKEVIVEHIHYDEEDNLHYIEVHGHPIFDNKGKVTKMIEYALDITERKKAEEALQEKMEELKKMNKVMVGRELRMIELKKEVNKLCKELGRPEPYNVL